MQGQRHQYVTSQLYNVTASDTTEAVFSDAYGIPGYCTGFHISGTDGTMTVTGVDASSSASSNLYVLKGTYYPYAVRKFWSTGTAPAITIVAVR